MSFDFYNKLSIYQKNRYDLMLDTVYILLRSDEIVFLETDQHDNKSMSMSWLPSLRPFITKFGFKLDTYPQGSISANRFYYEGIRNYFGGTFPKTDEFNLLRQRLVNFLNLRRDDSSPHKSLLFGSYYSIVNSNRRDQASYRAVDVSMRHAATALWILVEETKGGFSPQVEESIKVLLFRVDKYLSENEDWQSDVYRFLTISSIMNTFNAILRKKPPKLTDKTLKLKQKCITKLLSDKCMRSDLTGNYEWYRPDKIEYKMATYEYFMNAFTLTQVPELLCEGRIQSIISGMISNRVNTKSGTGIPIHRQTDFTGAAEIVPDFGTTSMVLYLLWRSLEYNIGDASWQDYCLKNFDWLLSYCINNYDNKNAYVVPYMENNVKVLLMPKYNSSPDRELIVSEIISKTKRVIFDEIEQRKGKLNKALDKIEIPGEFKHIGDLIKRWQITEQWKEQKHWGIECVWGWGPSEVGEFVAGAITGVVKSFSRP